MTTLRLERYCYSRQGTFGELALPDVILTTVERRWANNRPFDSCLPEGVYQLVKHRSQRYGDRWHLVNKDIVALEKTPGVPRYACLFHTANLPEQVQGCIAPAMRPGVLGHEWAGLDSARALRLFDSYLGDSGEHTLIITPRRIDWP